MIIRVAEQRDKIELLKLVESLSKFNRENHEPECKSDAYYIVLSAIRERAEMRFDTDDKNIRILVVETDGRLVGYAIGEIYEESLTSDNGTGKIGLFDELFLAEEARGCGLGQKLLDEIMIWFKNNKINRVKLHAYSWNKHAKEMYKRNGFSEYAVSYEKFL
jgi:GNAT superfamily N-acetyltransferase